MSFPSRVTIELTNRCNRSCEMCPRHKMTYPLGNIDLDLLKKIVKQLPKNTIIVPFFRGESVCHPKFVEVMKILEKFDTVQMATNGDGLTKEVQNAIIRTCSFVSFSIHDSLFPNLVPEVTKFLIFARTVGIDTQVSIVDTMILSSTVKDVFIASWSKCVNRIRIYIEHSHDGFGDIDPKYKLIKEIKPCNKPDNDMVVLWDGKVVLCNHAWDDYNALGDLNDKTVKEVWNGDSYKTVRKLNKKCKIKDLNCCKDCDQWMAEYFPNKILGEVYN